jgi:hypothetical protein
MTDCAKAFDWPQTRLVEMAGKPFAVDALTARVRDIVKGRAATTFTAP